MNKIYQINSIRLRFLELEPTVETPDFNVSLSPPSFITLAQQQRRSSYHNEPRYQYQLLSAARSRVTYLLRASEGAAAAWRANARVPLRCHR